MVYFALITGFIGKLASNPKGALMGLGALVALVLLLVVTMLQEYRTFGIKCRLSKVQHRLLPEILRYVAI